MNANNHLYRHPTILDGGYISWVYGVRPETWQGWEDAKFAYMRGTNSTIILEGGKLFRNDYYPDYKIDRVIRTQSDPARMERRLKVKEFVATILEPDHTIDTVRHLGHEADDIVAAYCVLWQEQEPGERPMRVIGTDKDLVQLGDRRIYVEKHSGDRVTVLSFASKLQKAIKDFVVTPEHILMCLVMLGDKSDSVPRILPKGAKELRKFATILQAPEAWRLLVTNYDKDEIMRNLYLTILPGPWVFDPIPSPEDVLDLLVENGLETYYSLPIHFDIMDSFAQNVQRPTYSDIKHREQQDQQWDNMIEMIKNTKGSIEDVEW